MTVVVACGGRGIPLYGPSGASAHLRGVARAIAGRGHDVRVAALLADDVRGRWDDAPPIPAVHLRTRWPRGLRTVGARVDGHLLALVARVWSADLVWERHEPRTGAFGRWSRACGVERWVELNAPLSLERRWPEAARPRELAREGRALRSADKVLAVSRWLADWAVDQGCDPGRVLHVPNGVDPQPPGDRERTRADLRLDGPVVGFVGSGHAWHGADRIPAMLDALGPDWTGLVVGAANVPAHPRLVATGHVAGDRVPDLVSAMDVAVAPYRRTAPPWFCPLKVLGARAQGVPVVAADLGDCRALVGGHGVVLDTDDDEAWADAIRRAAGLARVPEVRTWGHVVAEAGLPDRSVR